MGKSLSTHLRASVIYQPHIAQTWLLMAIIVSGAKYAVKIIPSTSAANKYINAFNSELFCIASNILDSHSAMNCLLFNGKIN